VFNITALTLWRDRFAVVKMLVFFSLRVLVLHVNQV